MTDKRETGYTVAGVDVGWLESVVPGIEELAESLPEKPKPCRECGGTGWTETVHATGYTEFTRCDCQRELGGSG